MNETTIEPLEDDSETLGAFIEGELVATGTVRRSTATITDCATGAACNTYVEDVDALERELRTFAAQLEETD